MASRRHHGGRRLVGGYDDREWNRVRPDLCEGVDGSSGREGNGAQLQGHRRRVRPGSSPCSRGKGARLQLPSVHVAQAGLPYELQQRHDSPRSDSAADGRADAVLDRSGRSSCSRQVSREGEALDGDWRGWNRVAGSQDGVDEDGRRRRERAIAGKRRRTRAPSSGAPREGGTAGSCTREQGAWNSPGLASSRGSARDLLTSRTKGEGSSFSLSWAPQTSLVESVGGSVQQQRVGGGRRNSAHAALSPPSRKVFQKGLEDCEPVLGGAPLFVGREPGHAGTRPSFPPFLPLGSQPQDELAEEQSRSPHPVRSARHARSRSPAAGARPVGSTPTGRGDGGLGEELAGGTAFRTGPHGGRLGHVGDADQGCVEAPGLVREASEVALPAVIRRSLGTRPRRFHLRGDAEQGTSIATRWPEAADSARCHPGNVDLEGGWRSSGRAHGGGQRRGRNGLGVSRGRGSRVQKPQQVARGTDSSSEARSPAAGRTQEGRQGQGRNQGRQEPQRRQRRRSQGGRCLSEPQRRRPARQGAIAYAHEETGSFPVSGQASGDLSEVDWCEVGGGWLSDDEPSVSPDDPCAGRAIEEDPDGLHLHGSDFLNAASRSSTSRFRSGDMVAFGEWLLEQIQTRPGRMRAFTTTVLEGFTGSSVHREDLLPLPVVDVDKYAVASLHPWILGDGPAGRLRRERGIAVWMWLVVSALNFLHEGRGRVVVGQPRGLMPLTDVQHQVLKNLELEVVFFLETAWDVPAMEWETMLANSKCDYSGGAVRESCKLNWDLVAPALPQSSECGRVPALALATGGVRHLLESPEILFRDKETWPEKAPRATLQVLEGNHDDLFGGLLERGILGGGVPSPLVVDHFGGVLENGLFGVEKDERHSSGAKLQRLIMNLVPLNSLLYTPSGDVGTLPFFGQWLVEQLSRHQRMRFCSEDLRCFFYLFSLPPQWSNLMTFTGVPVHLSPSGILFSKVLAMGWLASVAVAQHLHRELALRLPSLGRDVIHSGAGLPRSRELRKDRPHPSGLSSGTPSASWQIYLDNFDTMEISEGNVETSLEWQRLIRLVYAEWGLPRHPGKCVEQGEQVTTLGATRYGDAGKTKVKPEKTAETLALGGVVIARGSATLTELRCLVGRLVYALQYRRAGMCCLRYCFEFIHRGRFTWRRREGRLVLPRVVIDEIALALMLCPLLRMDHRMTTISSVTASDASESGGGLCRSTGLTPAGRDFVAAQRRSIRSYSSDEEHAVFCLGDPCGSVFRAFDALRVNLCGRISLDSDPSAAKTKSRWGPLNHFTDEVSEAEVKLVCLGLSRARYLVFVLGLCGGKEKEHNRLQSAGEIIAWLRRWGPWLEIDLFIWRTGASACESLVLDNRSLDSVVLELEPPQWLDLTMTVWTSWPLGAAFNERIKLKATRLLVDDWADASAPPPWDLVALPVIVPNAHAQGTDALPGASRGRDSRQRLRQAADQYRFPLAYYAVDSLLGQGANLRTFTSEELEQLLGYEHGHTSRCWNRKQRSADLWKWRDARLTLLATSPPPVLVTWVLAQLLFGDGYLFEEASGDDAVRLCNEKRLVEQEETLDRLLRRPASVCGDMSECDMVNALVGRCSFRGTDVRLSTGVPFDPRGWQVSSTPAKFWRWRTVLGWKWRTEGHITGLEARAVLSSLRWRARKAANLNSRLLHMVDSRATMGAVVKGRSSSRMLAPILEKIGALVLATGFAVYICYVNTHQNPADAPSRWFEFN